MIRLLLVTVLLIFFNELAFSQKLTISGTVRDAANGEILIGATVSDSLAQDGVQTNAYGFFSLDIPSKDHSLKVSFVGYAPVYIRDFAQLQFPLNIKLSQANLLQEVKITESKHLRSPIGSLILPMDKIKAIPALLGEADVLKALSLTPGISTGTEGSAGLYVRGGTPDQNLILLDEVPVYNVMHLGGFFSVFNPSSLKSVELYKGAFPARYGGRLASVINLTMKDGNNKKFGGEVGIGILNQNLTLEGPIIKNKASFIVSGRVSTLGLSSLIASAKRSGYGETRKYNFYDLNAKINYQLNKTDQLFLSFYSGYDRFSYSDWSATKGRDTETTVGQNWGNTTGTLRYSKVFSQKLFARIALLYTKYNSQFINNFDDVNPGQEPVNYFRNINAGIEDIGSKIQFDYFPNNRFTLKFGLDVVRHAFSPFATKSNYNGFYDNFDTGKLPATQLDAFVDSDIALSSYLSLNAGLRYSRYQVRNRTFYNPEPRIGLSWNLPYHWTLKSGLSVMNQYLHLLTNNGYGFGYDAWLPSTDKVRPSRASQISAGLYKTLPKVGLEFSLEVYSKNMKNLIDYPDGTNFTGLLAESWDEVVVKNGIGRVSGLEFMVNRNLGKWNGWISYTLSKSERKFAEINHGDWYPMKYDRRHNLSVTSSYTIGEKWKLSTSFIYQTGHAVTLPEAAIMTENNSSPKFIYDNKNNGRMPDFHRLDIGASKALTTYRNRKAELRFGFYNVYNRKNPLYLESKNVRMTNPVSTKIVMKQVSVFPILPYIGYTLKF